jgi:hypothetical protein
LLRKAFLLIYAIIIFVSCIQKNVKEQEKADRLSKPTKPETIEITDSMRFDNYVVNADTAYFFATADSSAKLNTFLTKDKGTIICKIKDNYGYAVLLTDSVIYQRGWLSLKSLTRILFTPPKIVKE